MHIIASVFHQFIQFLRNAMGFPWQKAQVRFHYFLAKIYWNDAIQQQ